MKTLKIITILLLTIITYSCSSDNVADEQEETHFIKAKIDGTTFLSDFPVIQNLDNVLAIDGQNNNNTILVQIYIKLYNGSGTYTCGSGIENENSFFILNNGSWIADKDFGTGTITITENGKLLTGTFSCTAIKGTTGESMNITEGTFRINKPI